MAGLGSLFGEGEANASQFMLWAVAQQMASSLLAPVLQEAQNGAWSVAIDANGEGLHVPLSPEALAGAVLKGYLSQDDAAGQAAESGITGTDFNTLVNSAGDSLGPEAMAVALRRGLIELTGSGNSSTSFDQGILESRLKPKWGPVVQQLAKQWPTPNDALNALLEGQVSQGDAQSLYELFGGDPDYFTLLFNTRGQAPTPMEALRMLNRKIIAPEGTGPDSTSYQQAFLEGPWRNKWLPAFQQLGVYVPPPRTITTLQSHGVITEAEAEAYYSDNGMDAHLAQVYAESATAQRLATARNTAIGTIRDLYFDAFIDNAKAVAMLETLGYTAEQAGFELEVVDMRRALTEIGRAVTRIGNLVVNHKLDVGSAETSLASLGLPSTQIAYLAKVWTAEAAANVKVLTAAQIEQAVAYNIITLDEGITALGELGYTPHDAWIMASIWDKGPLANEPAPGANPVY